MATPEDLHDLDVELGRVVDRLNSMPLARAATATDACLDTANRLVDATRALGVAIPDVAEVPRLGPQGLGAMLAVLGRDYRQAAEAAVDSDVRPMVDDLAELRRSLP